MIEIRRGSIVAQINNLNDLNNQLVSLSRDGREYMWGGAKPDSMKSKEEMNKNNWQNSEIIMFPVIGASYGKSIRMNGVSYPMPQHGIARYIPRKKVAEVNDDGVEIKTSTKPDEFRFMISYLKERVHSNIGVTELPIRFVLNATYKVTSEGLDALFSIRNDGEPFPYAFGWHPAFLIEEEKGSLIIDKLRNKHYTLNDVRNASPTNTLLLEGSRDVCYVEKDRFINVKSKDMNHTAVWSPNSHMFCIEPLTAPFSPSHLKELSTRSGYKMLGRKQTVEYGISIEIL